MKFRIVPHWRYNFALEKKFFIFWDAVAYSDRYEELVNRVKQVGGKLVK
jgi:hypothetical protein